MVAWAEIRGVNASKAASVEVLKSIFGQNCCDVEKERLAQAL